MSTSVATERTSFVIGKCKKGDGACATVHRTLYVNVQHITADQYKAGDFDKTVAFTLNDVHYYATCAEHGSFGLRMGTGTVRADIACSAKCLSAKGVRCDCACGGLNHGAGHGS